MRHPVGWRDRPGVVDLIHPESYPATLEYAIGLPSHGLRGSVRIFAACSALWSQWSATS